jgi:aldehyde dehydrogenase (NAD+)
MGKGQCVVIPSNNWVGREQGEGHEFLHEATQVKNIWVPTGE